jgi:transposase
MPQNFLPCDRDQELLLPPSLRDWLPADHLAYFVTETVDELELEAFYAAYRADGHGRAAHDPRMMVSLLVYSYSVGVRSARGIERRCREDVAFRMITANQPLDHATIARFRVRHEAAISDLFTDVLGLCAKAGLVKVGVVAVDGTKIAAAATHHQNRTYRQIAEEILKEAGEIDAAEDELYGEKRGDELPEGFGTATERRARLREAKLALEAERAAKAKKIPRDRGKRLKECWARMDQDLALHRRVEAEHEAWREQGIASNGRRCMNPHYYRPAVLPDEPEGKLNVTDPDSRNLKTTRGYVQGYNAQALVGEGQIVIAAEISTESMDSGNLEPMVAKACEELAAAGVSERPGVALADAGYWKNDAIEKIINEHHIQTLVAPDADKRKEPRPGRRGGLYDFTRQILASDAGAQLYLKRQGTVEPVFAQIKSNRGFRRFSRRGRSAVRSEWRLMATTHNLLKLHQHQLRSA